MLAAATLPCVVHGDGSRADYARGAAMDNPVRNKDFIEACRQAGQTPTRALRRTRGGY